MSENSAPLTCAFHPKKETRLRCNKCGKPICPKCAKHTPTGYRCPECIKNQQKVFITAKWYDYLWGSLVAAFISLLGSFLAQPFGFYIIFIAPILGSVIERIVRKIVKNRRSHTLYQVVAAASFFGSAPAIIIGIISAVGLGMIFPLIWVGLYAIVVTSTVYSQLT